jgi:hypothetical protein
MNSIDYFLPVLPGMAPKKRFRDKRRYYAKLARESENFSLDGNGWYDLWHRHFDWPGHGNRTRKDRIQHLTAYARAFMSIAKAFADSPPAFKYQMFISVVSHDSSQDALYFTTPNPNENLPGHERFPIQEHSGSWEVDADIQKFFGCMFPGFSMRYCLTRGRLLSRGILLYSPGVGVPLERP